MTSTNSRSLLLAAYTARRLRLLVEIAHLDRKLAKLRAGVSGLGLQLTQANARRHPSRGREGEQR
jgi:hypothetical protein